ncbi:response regulator [Calothrix sp. NIES-3974]|uniref:response regulator n=1 Tax=Calothrix sp. NIES-3974 TaxID=2005462 RepID=UPI000B5E474D|nr:response regulator [Calothrix sp. NIES-3974]BAZ04918.1 response regulator receiver protein PatA [Calothrix sp. NIES-3974]
MVKTINIGKQSFLHPSDNIALLQETAVNYKTGKLEVSSSPNTWSFFWEDGYLFYGFSGIESGYLFARKIEEISPENPMIQAKLAQITVPELLEHQSGDREVSALGVDEQHYLLMCWLVEQKYLSILEVQNLITDITKKAITSFLEIPECELEFIANPLMNSMPKFCYLDLADMYVQENNWLLKLNRFDGEIGREKTLSLSPENQRETFMFNVVEAKSINQETNLTKIPNYPTPENSIPTQFLDNAATFTPETPSPQLLKASPVDSQQQAKREPDSSKKLYKILCIDDSPMILKAIRGYLDEQIFQVIGIDDSLKALVEILRHQPDVILLDISMPNLDGYELCSLLRKHAKFQNTPIIMVTGRTGLIDKARAKLVKASGYLNKPFSKAALLKILFQNLAKLDK